MLNRGFVVSLALLALPMVGLCGPGGGTGPGSPGDAKPVAKPAAKPAAAKPDKFKAPAVRKKPAPPKARYPNIVNHALVEGRQATYAAIRVIDTAKGPLRERVVYSNGWTRVERGHNVIIMGGGTRTVYDKGANTVRKTVLMGSDPMVPMLDRLGPNATYVVTPGQQMEGRTVDQVEITPNPGKPNRSELWIDEQSGVIMAAKISRDPTLPTVGYHLESLDLAYHPAPNDFSTTFPGANLISPRQDLARVAKNTALPPLTIPDGVLGYTLESADRRNLAGAAVLHQTFTAKNKVVSMFVLAQVASPERLKEAAGNQHFTLIVKGSISVVLIGNVPQPELEALKTHVSQ